MDLYAANLKIEKQYYSGFETVGHKGNFALTLATSTLQFSERPTKPHTMICQSYLNLLAPTLLFLLIASSPKCPQKTESGLPIGAG
jgi:hypothetical protein